MKRRRKVKEFEKFPAAPVEKEAAIEDARSMDYMSKFRDHHVRTVFYLALLGMTDEQMAVVFDINLSTFCTWKKKHPTFLEALRSGKEQADAKMVYSLYQAGIGYEHDSEQIFCSKEKEYDPTTGKLIRETPKIIRVPIRKQYPPNVKAALRWLECRQPEQWSQKENKASKLTLVQNNYDIHDLSNEELQVLKKLMAQNAVNDDAMFQTTHQRALKEIQIEP